MTDWNMPPGCRASDIPGNRPEDVAYERLYEDVVCVARDRVREVLHDVTTEDIADAVEAFLFSHGASDKHLTKLAKSVCQMVDEWVKGLVETEIENRAASDEDPRDRREEWDE